MYIIIYIKQKHMQIDMMKAIFRNPYQKIAKSHFRLTVHFSKNCKTGVNRQVICENLACLYNEIRKPSAGS
ncbi:hypothetical protein AE956_20195 [Bacteroides fragilis]|nr:hypothetical protein [Bacteroides fragilis]